MKKIIILTCLLHFYVVTKSQNQITEFLIGTSESLMHDTESLIESYMNPIGEWFGTGLNAGWYNSAKAHQFPGFDVTAGFHVIHPPSTALYFKPTDLEYLLINNDDQLSTILGPDDNIIELLYTNPVTQENEPLFNAPGGLNWNHALLMPYIQGSIGLIKKTELLFRYAPAVNLKKLKTGFWGFGIKHDIKQWIPGIKVLPFDLSFIGAYSKLNSKYDFQQSGQNLSFNVKAFNSNFVMSKKIAFLTPYVGLGYQYSNSDLSLNGDYIINNWNDELGIIEQGADPITLSNPFDFSFGGVSGLKATVGARIKLLLFTIHIDWTKAQYDIFTIGFGLNSDIGSKLIGGTIDKAIIK